MDFSHLQKLLNSRNAKIQWAAVILAFLAWIPLGVDIWENPNQTIAARISDIAQSLAIQLGGPLLLSIRPEELEDPELIEAPPSE